MGRKRRRTDKDFIRTAGVDAAIDIMVEAAADLRKPRRGRPGTRAEIDHATAIALDRAAKYLDTRRRHRTRVMENGKVGDPLLEAGPAPFSAMLPVDAPVPLEVDNQED